MKIADIILGIRSRLGDNDFKKYRYQDTEIIDAINSALAFLSDETLYFRRWWSIRVKAGVSSYELPHDFLRLISVQLGDRVIRDIVSEDIALNERDRYFGREYVSFTNQILSLYPTPTKDNIELKIRYNQIESVSSVDEELNLTMGAKEAVIYGALALLFENPIKKDGLAIANRYRNLRDIEIVRIKSRIRKSVQSRDIRVGHRVV